MLKNFFPCFSNLSLNTLTSSKLHLWDPCVINTLFTSIMITANTIIITIKAIIIINLVQTPLSILELTCCQKWAEQEVKIGGGGLEQGVKGDFLAAIE